MPEFHTDREECEHAVRGAMTGALSAYFERHPERIAAAYDVKMKIMVDAAVRVVKVLDGYEITKKAGNP